MMPTVGPETDSIMAIALPRSDNELYFIVFLIGREVIRVPSPEFVNECQRPRDPSYPVACVDWLLRLCHCDYINARRLISEHCHRVLAPSVKTACGFESPILSGLTFESRYESPL